MNRARSMSLVVAAALCSTVVRGDDAYTLRMASVAPDGSFWAREARVYARHVEAQTNGRVRIKWFFNGMAGDEIEQGERVRRGQLDGGTSGHFWCQSVAPTLRVARLSGLFQNRDEAVFVMNQLEPQLRAEAHESGLALLSNFGVGPDVLFTRVPVHSLAELRKLKLWRWDLDDVGIAISRAMGLTIVPLPLSEAARAFDEGRIDGFVAIPTAALAFQWALRAKWVIDLRTSYIWGCLMVAEHSLERLPPDDQEVLRRQAADAGARIEVGGREIDESLLGGLLKKMGATPVPVSEMFRHELFEAARRAREQVAEKYVSKPLLDRVLKLLADYRAEHK